MLRLLVLAGLAMTMLGSASATAQEATYYTVTYMEAGPILSRPAAVALRDFRDAARKDPSNVSLEILQRMDRPNQFVVLGSWTDQKAFEAHWATTHANTLGAKIETMLAAPNDTRQHTGLSVVPATAIPASAVYVVTHVDVVPPQKDNAVEALKQLAEDSRGHVGNLRFDVWQQTNRPNHFTVIEAWSNRGAFDVHQMQKTTKDFRGKLITMTGSLYDERLYKSVP